MHKKKSNVELEKEWFSFPFVISVAETFGRKSDDEV